MKVKCLYKGFFQIFIVLFICSNKKLLFDFRSCLASLMGTGVLPKRWCTYAPRTCATARRLLAQ